MQIEEFRTQFIDQLRFNAEHDGTDPETQFITRLLDELESIGELNDPIPMSIEMRGKNRRLMAFDAYAYDEADSALILIASDFVNERDTVPTLTNTRINDLYIHMRNFLDECINGHIHDYCDDSDPAINLAKEFRHKIGKGMIETEILRFKFYILSNSVLSKQVKSISQEDFEGRPVELNIWTLERIFQTFTSNVSEIIEFDTKDFGCDGVQCLQADLGIDTDYDAYLGIVPGNFLANLYLKYGSKLLQGNVRAFLSVRGKVNKGIRDTIINHPENFFTYNNGIAIVARAVRFSADKTKIIHFKDPQIINGGQTTASLANAIIKKEDKKGMDTLFVPMKLTVLNVEDDMSEEQVDRYNEITKTISQCANCQNPVSDADFFSNHPFHVAMEKLSRQVMAPPVDGKPYQTTWFYERSRGKWEQEQMKMTVAERKKFGEMHPKNQVIKKEKLAKCLNTIYMNPHQVCQSSAINFSKFASIVEKMYDESRDSINEEFFKKAVCSVIIFDTLDSRIGRSSWYPKGGNKAQITPYTIAKLMTLIPKNKDLDWKTIWQRQTLYPALEYELLRLAECTHHFLMEQANGGIVRTISRTQGVWNAFQEYKFQLSDEFIQTLISMEETKSIEAAAKRAHKFNSNIDASIEIFNLGATYWLQVYNDLLKEKVLSYGDLDFIKGVASYIQRGNLPSTAQCKRLVKIVAKAEDKGYIMP
ncbi:AIPR family protein [Parabacteroides chinchillae]|uniref:AIPR protein n=1 Tax=Parabacteroides chinchillae TaxID=871327 RepID=A0A8G2F552_9BACT|nr:AIPR family protein [Parabacteroides chinchillae]SEF90561.1 AIPR protein [Parabacteroides chinchillae]